MREAAAGQVAVSSPAPKSPTKFVDPAAYARVYQLVSLNLGLRQLLHLWFQFTLFVSVFLVAFGETLK